MQLFTFLILATNPGISALTPSDVHCVEKQIIEHALNPEWDIDPRHLLLTVDSILVNRYQTMVELDFKGKTKQVFHFEKGAQIANFSYLPELDLVAVVLVLDLEAKPPIYQTRFYDRIDQSYFIGYDLTQQAPTFSYFTQFISTADDRLFLNRWTRANSKADDFLLQEIELMPYAGGYEIAPKGDPFHMNRREFEPNSQTFRRRWIVPQNQELLVINQVQPILKRYTYPNNDKRKSLVEKEGYVDLPGWVHPYQKRLSMPHLKWFYSFSQNVGLYGIGSNGDLLWGYITPNSYNSEDTQSEENGDVEPPLHNLNLQLLDRNTQPIKSLVEIEGGRLIGVMDRTAFVLLPRDRNGQYAICQLEF